MIQPVEWVYVAAIAVFVLALNCLMQVDRNDRCVNTITKIKIEHCR